MSARALNLIFTAMLVGSVWWRGATRPPATLVLATASALLLLFAAWRAKGVGQPLRLTPLAWPPLLTAGLASLQLLPLPPALLSWLSPDHARTLARMLGDAGVGWRPLTLDVAATVAQVARLLGIAALAVAVAPRGNDDRVGLRGALVVALLALLVVPTLSALHLLHPVAAVPDGARMRFSLQNPNHAAALLAAVLPVVLAKAARSVGSNRFLLVALLLGGNVALLGTGSRAGIGVGVLVQLAVGVLLVSRQGSRHRAWWVFGMTTIGIASTALLALDPGLLVRLPTLHTTRLLIWRDTLPLIRDHVWTGVGRGAFAFAFARYSSQAGALRHAFAENEYLQLACDLGAVGAIAIAASLAFVALRLVGALRGRPGAAAAAAGALALGLHNAVDFSWESGAVASCACALGALALPSCGLRVGGVVASLLASATLLFTALSASAIGATAEDELPRLPTARDAREANAIGLEILARHPADAFVATATADRLLVLGSADALDWIERALVLAPRDVTAHQLAARALLRAGLRAQAAGELRVALDNASDEQRGPLLADIRRSLFGDTDGALLVGALSSAADRQAMLAEAVRAKRWPLVDALSRALDEDATDVAVLRMLIAAARERKTDGVVLAERLLAASPLAIDVALAAQTLAAAGQASRALGIVDAALARAIEVRNKVVLHLARAEVLDNSDRPNEAAAERAEAARLSRH